MYLGIQLRYSGLAACIYQLSHLGGHTVSIYHLPHEEIAKLESSPNLTAIPRLPQAAQRRDGTAKEVAAFLETQLSLFCGLSAKVMTMCGLCLALGRSHYAALVVLEFGMFKLVLTQRPACLLPECWD